MCISYLYLLSVALVCGVAFGVADPTLGCLAHKYSLSRVSTFGIFFISGNFSNVYLYFFSSFSS